MNITRATYDQIAPHFAEINRQIPAELLVELQKFVAMLNGEWCLDLGCGAGRDIAWLESRNLRMIGADFSPGMLAEARKMTASPLAQMDMRWMAFCDQAFDGIWCNAALLHLPKVEAPGALQEMRRILRPGGILLLALQQGMGETWETNLYTFSGERFFARYTQNEAIQMLEYAGFSIMDAHDSATSGRRWLRFLAKT